MTEVVLRPGNATGGAGGAGGSAGVASGSSAGHHDVERAILGKLDVAGLDWSDTGTDIGWLVGIL